MVTPENIRVGFCVKVVRHLRRRLSLSSCPQVSFTAVENGRDHRGAGQCEPLSSGTHLWLPSSSRPAGPVTPLSGWMLTAGKEPRQLREAQHRLSPRIPGASAAGVHSCTLLEQSWGRVVPVLGSHGHQQSRFPDWKDAKTSSNTLVHAWHPST